MRVIVTLLTILLSSNAFAVMFIWKENGVTQMRSYAPDCYKKPVKGCPKVVVYENGQVISDSRSEIDESKRNQIATLPQKQNNPINKQAPTSFTDNKPIAIENVNTKPDAFSVAAEKKLIEAEEVMKNSKPENAIGAAIVARGLRNDAIKLKCASNPSGCSGIIMQTPKVNTYEEINNKFQSDMDKSRLNNKLDEINRKLDSR